MITREPSSDASLSLSGQYFLYLIWYTVMSVFGHFNNFFFAAHLLDIAMGFKTLRTILSSVTHNGKQASVRPPGGDTGPVALVIFKTSSPLITAGDNHQILWSACGNPLSPQLVLTVGLLAVIVYLYTVVAFNFFRKFYNKSEDEDEPDMKCDDMMTVRPPPPPESILRLVFDT